MLIREAQVGSDGELLESEVNPWGIRFKRMLDMSTDSGLFLDQPDSDAGALNAPRSLPLYEAKMIHQFDHRWATYVDAPDKPDGLDTADLSLAQRADPNYTVRPRYWIPERVVLAKIANVPERLARSWLAWHAATTPGAAQESALAELLLAVATWVAGELFTRAVGEHEAAEQTRRVGWPQQRALPHVAPTEAQLKSRFEPLSKALLGTGLTTKKALAEFPKWALQNLDVRLSDEELDALSRVLKAPSFANELSGLLDKWMDQRSPRWLMGWRDICRSTDYRTLISSVIPRTGVGDKYLLMTPQAPVAQCAALLGNLNALVCDFVARQKVGGTSFKYFTMKQIAVLPPERYSDAALDFIVPRVLELTFTAQDMKPWADDLAAYDLRPALERGQPFGWNLERRAKLRAELDAYYARLYGLTRDELRYILDPADVMGSDYPSETFRVLKNNEMRGFGEYRTQRLVLEAWDRLSAVSVEVPPVVPAIASHLSELGMVRNQEEAMLAGLIVALVEQRSGGSSVSELQSLVARSVNAVQYLDAPDGLRFTELFSSLGISSVATQLLDRVRPIVQRLESVGVLTRQARSGEAAFNRGASVPPGDVRQIPEHGDVARLLVAAESRRLESERAGTSSSEQTLGSTGTR